MFFRLNQIACAAAFLLASSAGHAVEYRWVAGTGSWNNPSAWAGGQAPAAGGGADVGVLIGRPSPTLLGSWTTTNNLGGLFTLNRLELAAGTSATAVLTNASGSGLNFGGPNARLAVTGNAAHTLANATGGLGVVLSDSLSIAMGIGSLAISAPISGAGGLVLSGPESSYGTGGLTLSGANSFSGGLTMNSGNLILNGTAISAPVGTGTFTINGGLISSTNTLTRLNYGMQLNSDLHFNTGNVALNGLISVGNAAANLLNDGGTINLNTALGISGKTVVGAAGNFYPAIGPATLTLGGNTSSFGTLLNTSAVRVAHGGTLILENSGSTTGNLGNRINDAATFEMASGTLVFRSAGVGSSETLGATSVAGYSILEARPGSSAGSVLTLESLQREDRGVLLVRGQNLGNAGVANRAQVLINGAKPTLVGQGGAAGSTQISIVPWMVGNYSTTSSTGNASTFVTYDQNGLRALNPATEFANALGGHAGDNVYLVGGSTNNANVTVNSLVLASGSIAGTGSLNISSGALMYTGQSATGIGNDINFGSAEAVITTSSPLTLAGQLTGSKGLTKAGAYSLLLSGDNSGLTGALTIVGNVAAGGSRIDINSAKALPGTGAITVYSPNSTAAAGLGISGSFTVDRDIVVKTGAVSLSSLTNDSFATFSGQISGEGGVIINSSLSFGAVRMSGDNSYTGATRIQSGMLVIGNDRELGAGGPLVLANATEAQGIALAGDWISDRTINLLYKSGLYSEGYDVVINGTMTGNADLHKYGGGSMTLNGDSAWGGKLYVHDGDLFVNGNTAANVFFDGEVMGGDGRVGDLNFLGTFVVGAGEGAWGSFGAASMTMLLGSEIEFDLGHDAISIDTNFLKADEGFGSKVSFDFGAASGLVAGQQYQLISFGGTSFAATDFSFTSSNAGLNGHFLMNGNALSFEVTAVPEPGTHALWLTGLAGMAAWVRRRRARSAS